MENLHPVAMLLITTAAIFIGSMLCYIALTRHADNMFIPYQTWQQLIQVINTTFGTTLLIVILATACVLYSIISHPFYSPLYNVTPVPSVPMPEQSQKQPRPVIVSATSATNTTAG